MTEEEETFQFTRIVQAVVQSAASSSENQAGKPDDFELFRDRAKYSEILDRVKIAMATLAQNVESVHVAEGGLHHVGVLRVYVYFPFCSLSFLMKY